MSTIPLNRPLVQNSPTADETAKRISSSSKQINLLYNIWWRTRNNIQSFAWKKKKRMQVEVERTRRDDYNHTKFFNTMPNFSKKTFFFIIRIINDS